MTLLLAFVFCSFNLYSLKDFKIEWIEDLEGDFSFSPDHSLESEAWCYEYAGVSEIKVVETGKDSIECYTLTNAATHSTLNFSIVNGMVSNPRIELNSVTGKKRTYFCNKALMKVDKKAFQKGIFKAEFDMTFNHVEDPKKEMFWKGKIYAKIK